MKNRKPTLPEQKEQLKAAEAETRRKLAWLDGELDDVLVLLKAKRNPEKEAPKYIVKRMDKIRKEIASMELNLRAINATKAHLGI